MTRIVVALGSNLGDRLAHLTAARDGIAAWPTTSIRSASRVYRTDPVGGPDQDEFLNAVLVVDTDLAPVEVLSSGQALERAARRVRDVRWGPRTLDVDIVDVEGFSSADPDLTVPHPRAHERAFVLVPWADAEPDAVLRHAGVARLVADWAGDAADADGVHLAAEQWARA